MRRGRKIAGSYALVSVFHLADKFRFSVSHIGVHFRTPIFQNTNSASHL
jgi:hypothetical protein